jgi:hypothetical protein
VAPGSAWQADSLELFIEGDYARSFDALQNASAAKFDVIPLPESGPPQALVAVSYGRLKETPEAVPAAWRRTARGYSLELLVPASVVEPARLEAGQRMGFHYILRDGGEVVEQFAETEGKTGVWRTPLHWGAVILGDAP